MKKNRSKKNAVRRPATVTKKSAVVKKGNQKVARKREPKEIPPPVLVAREWSKPPELQITKEAWEKPGGRVGEFSRIDWKSKGARAGLIRLAYRCFVADGCHYNVLGGGLVNKKAAQAEIDRESAKLTPQQKKKFRFEVLEHVLREYANELNSIIPFVRKPAGASEKGGSEFVRTYIVTSPIIDSEYGERVAQMLQAMRSDIVIRKRGTDRTRVKGVGSEEEKKEGGVILQHIVPRRHRLPGQYASGAMDKEVSEEEGSTETFPDHWTVYGFGSSVSKPGSGEKKIRRNSVPILHVPVAGKPGEPSLSLNQIGVRVIEVSADGETWCYRNYSFRDLVKDERTFVTGIKTGATELDQKIVDAVKKEREGLSIGEISDFLGTDREPLQKRLDFLVEAKALKRTTWPGLYFDQPSGRYNFHNDWFQDRLAYPWPYENYSELNRLIFGCMHAGYTTTDYEFMVDSMPKIILRRNITVLQICGDLIAGLKHDLIHRGEIIGNVNYTEQEMFASELIGTIIFKVFKARFEKKWAAMDEKARGKNAADLIRECLLTLVYIMGNHDDWQKDFGIQPGLSFRASLILLLTKHVGKFLTEKNLAVADTQEIVESKLFELPAHKPEHVFPGGVRTQIVHPRMGRSKTTSLRTEEALGFLTGSQAVDLANFHTMLAMEKWDPEVGQRVANQLGTLIIASDFENGKMKTVDFGAVYSGIRSKDGRIMMSEVIFYNKAILKEPISKHTDIRELRKRLGVLQSPLWPA